ncbi:GDP-L-fucose synthase [Ancylomarina sp. 16SWW S1-10-2]|uniref:GDP-L-fucose synthase family protein n=1 Tax=Ancylomarina sp. 16SWW S1-10-2 TaxID=2499681 RepID=UPI0012ADCF83|nr:GDP-L-fucose synthase [Ancylomarina sp. 16SWW S1-10-2]MRT91918.1 GDP-L-fucose synthase [Ancylomarina sp. 16SWW S1-10-2]
MKKDSKIFIAGHRGLVGSAIMRNLQAKGYNNIITRTHAELDLLNQQAVINFFADENPDYVVLAAAKVGGIIANSIYRGQFIYENLQIQNNVIHQAYVQGVKKLLFLGSSCIYPKNAPQPMTEDCLLSSALEPTNEPYAISKIAGLKMCEAYNQQYGTDYIAVMPTNLYGENDNYDLEKSHVLPALIRKMHLGKCLQNNDWDALRSDLNKLPIEGISGEATEEEILAKLNKYGISLTDNQQPTTENSVAVTLWGTGSPFREFLHADDMADACTYLLENISAKEIAKVNAAGVTSTVGAKSICENSWTSFLNVGTGKDLTIKALAEKVKEIIGFQGELVWDDTKPDGTFKKLLDVSKLNELGWKETIALEEGIEKVYENYKLS